MGACLRALAAVLHLGIIVKGATWYRFFGAGESMARAAEEGRWYPAIVTTAKVARSLGRVSVPARPEAAEAAGRLQL